uniref:Secreted protein n=1 Tax=Steinernema glaseri TaxID=37863 RepID=A0A1I7ZIA8_9BILA
MARLTLVLLFTVFVAFVAITVSKPTFIVTYNAAPGDEIDLSGLPTPDEVTNYNSTAELIEAIELLEVEKSENSTETGKKIMLIVL